MTDLKNKAIKIKGKDYVLVSDRVKDFNENHENGCIVTELISSANNTFIFKATVTPDVDHDSRAFTGYSQAVIGKGTVNETAALENAETSAVGRALGFMGIGIIDSVASADELHKATPLGNNVMSCKLCGKEMIDMTTKSGKPGKKCPDFKSTKDLSGQWSDNGHSFSMI